MPGRKVFDFVVIWFSWALAAILISNNTLSLFPAFFFSFLVLLAIILMFKYLTPIDDGPSYEPNLKEDLFAMGKVFFALYCILGFAIIVSSAFTIVGMATISHLAEIEMPKEGVGFTRDEGRVIFLLPLLFLPTIMAMHNLLAYGKMSLLVLQRKNPAIKI